MILKILEGNPIASLYTPQYSYSKFNLMHQSKPQDESKETASFLDELPERPVLSSKSKSWKSHLSRHFKRIVGVWPKVIQTKQQERPLDRQERPRPHRLSPFTVGLDKQKA